jgi:hypothetical protein
MHLMVKCDRFGAWLDVDGGTSWASAENHGLSRKNRWKVEASFEVNFDLPQTISKCRQRDFNQSTSLDSNRQ